jgi:hypothetical protein
VPFEFVAVTVNVYDVPLVRLGTVQLVAVVVVQVFAPGEDVTVYPVIVVPPVFDGAVHETTDWPFALLVADTSVGDWETPNGVIAVDALDATESPEAFVAFTVNV